MSHRKTPAIVILALLVLAGSAMADTIETKYVGKPAWRAFTIDLTKDGNTYTRWAHYGLYELDTRNPTGDAAAIEDPTFAFCIKPEKWAPTSFVTADMVDPSQTPYNTSWSDAPMGTARADLVRELWGRFYNANWAAGLDRDGAAAFALALQELIYEPTFGQWDTMGGDLKGRSDAATYGSIANNWIASLNGDKDFHADLAALRTENHQDFLIEVTAVPEPATMAVLAIGGLGAVIRRRRK